MRFLIHVFEQKALDRQVDKQTNGQIAAMLNSPTIEEIVITITITEHITSKKKHR